MIDYKELLRKYMDHVCAEEGTMFVGYEKSWNEEFSDEEWKELKRLAGPTNTIEGPLVRSPEYSKQQREWLLTQLTHNTK